MSRDQLAEKRKTPGRNFLLSYNYITIPHLTKAFKIWDNIRTMSSEQDSKIPVSEIPITRGSVFTRLVRIIPEQPERIPEPSLVDFLKRNRLHFGEIAGGKLQV